MDKLIVWEDKITLGGVALSDSDTENIKTLSLCMGEDIITTCDRLSVLLQTLSDAWETLKDLSERILEAGGHGTAAVLRQESQNRQKQISNGRKNTDRHKRKDKQ